MNDPEIRRIREGVEVVALFSGYLAAFTTMFSGWLVERPTGWEVSVGMAVSLAVGYWAVWVTRKQK